MPVTLTVDELAVLLRQDYLDTQQRFVLQTHINSAKSLIEKVAPPGVPDTMLNTAAARVAGYLYEAPSVPDTPVGQALLSRVGVSSLLEPWRIHRALPLAPTGEGAGALPGAPAPIDDDAVNALIEAALGTYASRAWVLERGFVLQGALEAYQPKATLAAAVGALPGARVAEALEQDTVLLAGETRQLLAGFIPLALAAAVPAPREGRRVRLNVFIVGGADDLTAYIDVDVLSVKTPATAAALDDSTSLSFAGEGGGTYRVGRSATNHFVVGSSAGGNFRFALVQEDIQPTPYVDFPPKQTRLDPAAALPPPPAYAQGVRQDGIPLGSLQSYGGDLYVLVAQQDDGHIWRGLATAPGAGRVGLAGQFTWATPASGVAGAYRCWLPKSIYRTGPVGPGFTGAPAVIYAVAATDTGERVFGVPLRRSAANDTASGLAYRNTTNEAGFEGAAGDRVQVELYRSADEGQLSSPLRVHSGDRWERYVDLVDLTAVRSFALVGTDEADARAGLAALVNGATADAQRIDYAALKNRPVSLVREIHSGNIDTVVNSATSHETTLAAVSSAYTIPAGAHGMLLGTAVFSIVGTTAPQIALGDLGVMAIEDLLSRVRTGLAWAANQSRGIVLAQVNVLHSDTIAVLGVLKVYLARDGGHNLGIYRRYEAVGGLVPARAATTVRCALTLNLLRTDGG